MEAHFIAPLLAALVAAWPMGCGGDGSDGAGDAGTGTDSGADFCASDEVRQPETDLCWLRCPLGQDWAGDSCDGTKAEKDWCDASGLTASGCTPDDPGADLCELTFGPGYRLPTRDEFMALLGNCVESDVACYTCDDCTGSDGQTTCTGMFTADDGYYWSSTPCSVEVSWCAYFGSGDVCDAFASNEDHVRCLHEGP